MCATAHSDFFKAVPKGRRLRHGKTSSTDWNDEQAATIRQCRHRASSKDAKVILITP
ncbi:MAG TPA: hypothetical protein VIM00_03695 [Candidatus Acidoferrum sp.]